MYLCHEMRATAPWASISIICRKAYRCRCVQATSLSMNCLAGDIIVEVDGVSCSSISDVVVVPVAVREEPGQYQGGSPPVPRGRGYLVRQGLLAFSRFGWRRHDVFWPIDDAIVTVAHASQQRAHQAQRLEGVHVRATPDRRLSIYEKAWASTPCLRCARLRVFICYLPGGLADSPGNPKSSDRSCLQLRTKEFVIEFQAVKDSHCKIVPWI